VCLGEIYNPGLVGVIGDSSVDTSAGRHGNRTIHLGGYDAITP
jgi:hypothetical protein